MHLRRLNAIKTLYRRFALNDLLKGVYHAQHIFTLGLIPGAIHQKTGGTFSNNLHDLESVFLQSSSGLHKIYNSIGQANQWGELDGSRKRNDLHGNASRVVVIQRNTWIFRSNADCGVIRSVDGVCTLRSVNRNPTVTEVH